MNEYVGDIPRIPTMDMEADDLHTEPIGRPWLVIIAGFILCCTLLFIGYAGGCVLTRERAKVAAMATAREAVEAEMLRAIKKHEAITLNGKQIISVWHEIEE